MDQINDPGVCVNSTFLISVRHVGKAEVKK